MGRRRPARGLDVTGPAASAGARGASGAPEAVCLGETMAMIGPVDSTPLAEADALSLRVGGAESNVACGLTSLGHPAAWLGRVGDDPFGRRVLAELRSRGVDVSAVETDPVRRTGVYFKDTGASGTGVHYYRRDSAASRMGPALARLPLLGRACLLHLSGITPALSGSCAELIEEIIVRRAVPGRPLISFDVNHRSALWPVGHDQAAVTLLRLARAADLVFVGRDEAEALWGTGEPEVVRDLLAPAPHVVVKDAADGAYSYDGADDRVFVPTPRSAEVVERVGAGDAFAAGYLAALLEDRRPAARLRLGHLAAACTLTTRGDVAALPPRRELDQRLVLDDAAWARLRLPSRRSDTTLRGAEAP
jgi:2-dehydro-3-deoxygluconokinase